MTCLSKHLLFGNGRSFLLLTAAALASAGAFAIVLGVLGRFLPHDERYLGMSARELCERQECRIVHFMIHNRISFGGTLIVVGILYAWLTAGPLREGETWAWWTLFVSGAIGFASFFAYLGYGYLDTWHGLATLLLLPCFAIGMAQSLPAQESRLRTEKSLRSVTTLGRCCLFLAAAGIGAAGLVIGLVSMTFVLVPQDASYLGLETVDLSAINRRLVPLIAHDRAGFGGALCSCGIVLLCCVRYGKFSPNLWRTLAAVGVIGFGTAIGVHPMIGYIDFVHLGPAVLGAVVYVFGLALTYRPMMQERSS